MSLQTPSQTPFSVTCSMPLELYRAEQVREFDRIAIQECGIPGYTLMCRAGAAAFDALRARWPAARRLLAVCGGGNNGGDGYVVARLAKDAGLDAYVGYLSDPAKLEGDALTAYQDARRAGVMIQAFADPALTDTLAHTEIIVDAIFGTGLGREVQGRWREAIQAINDSAAPTVAIDIPSGLHADSGAKLGIAVQAALTVSFIGLKQGLFSGQGPACCGEIVYADLAVPAVVFESTTPSCRRYAGADLPRLLPKRSPTAHKGHHGHVLVVGGDHGMAGAARMAAEAAARCGAGLVSIATRSMHAGLQAAVRPELMFRGVETVAELEPLLARATVIAVGPGLGIGEWGRLLLARVLAAEQTLVVDADALNILAEQAPRRERWVLTPHSGEAGRLLGLGTAVVEQDRYGAVARLQQRYGGCIVLKGAGSLVAGENGQITVSNSGNPGMGSGGMGDVLTGVIAGLLAQGLALADAARAGVYLHGRAGELAARGGERGMLATDLLPELRLLVNP